MFLLPHQAQDPYYTQPDKIKQLNDSIPSLSLQREKESRRQKAETLDCKVVVLGARALGL